ncbi:MAG: hypothetical protein JW768_07705 [Chitinispirillaceae bacterium]|nr:hypothetical protein [Chitinispirillaceae bacterium]
MRLSRALLMCALATAVVWAADAKKYVQPKENNVGIYKNNVRQVYEKPLFQVGTEDRLLILETKGDHYRVQSVEGGSGWVEKRLVVSIGKSKTFVFDNAEVVGYLDNPTPVYILDSDDPNAERIYLDRSFKEALRDNTDKETAERQVTAR